MIVQISQHTNLYSAQCDLRSHMTKGLDSRVLDYATWGLSHQDLLKLDLQHLNLDKRVPTHRY